MTTPGKEQSLERLIERVKAATGPDRELDGEIWRACLGAIDHGTTIHNRAEIYGPVPKLTASIDAALALVGRVLPEWVVSDLSQNSRHAGDPWGCTLALYFGSTPSKNRSASSGYDYPKPSLAILAALLHALKEHSNDHE